MNISVILLAGGVGSRMGSVIPKQFLTLNGKPIARHSFDLFCDLKGVNEVIVVCDPAYRDYFQSSFKVKFALPGERRQDSLWNGLAHVDSSSELICVHDSARPFLQAEMVLQIFEEAYSHGAAVAAVPSKNTIKESSNGFVNRTLDRSKLWEIQTPQVLRKDLLEKGFDAARRENLTVTDDVSLAELLNAPVKLVLGDYANIKITTREDLELAEFISERKNVTV